MKVDFDMCEIIVLGRYEDLRLNTVLKAKRKGQQQTYVYGDIILFGSGKLIAYQKQDENSLAF